METLEQNDSLRYNYREYGEQEVISLVDQLQEFNNSQLCRFFQHDLGLEIAEATEILIDTELSNDERNCLRGEIRAMKRLLLRFEDILIHLTQTENNRTNNID